MEDLSDASFLGKLLVLPANVRLDWKVIARYKHCSLFGLVVSNEGKKFYNIVHQGSSFKMSSRSFVLLPESCPQLNMQTPASDEQTTDG